MNYGYNKTTKDWKETKKWELAEALEEGLKIPIESRNKMYVNDGKSPYIEVDGSYEGVRIRRITWLSDEEQNKLVEEADKIYNKIMG